MEHGSFRNGGNPFGNFNPITPNTIQNVKNNLNNFNTAFADNNAFIERPDFRNRGNVLQDNLGEHLLLENIMEYQIYIDSKDRNTDVYQSPFNFTVSFGGSTGTNTYKGHDFKSTEGPVISRRFHNVKYIKLDYVILPRTITIDATKFDASKSYYVYHNSNTDNNLTDVYKYLILRVRELESHRVLSTNNTVSNSCFILYPDKIMGRNHIMWITSFGSRIYKSSLLKNIDRLTFELLTPDGDLLKTYRLVDDGSSSLVLEPFDIEREYKYSQDCPEESRESMETVRDILQLNVSLILGVVENELNTLTKYEA